MLHRETKFIIGFDFAVTLQKMIPLITCEISLCQYVCELVFGVNVFDLDRGVQIDSIEQPIKSNSVGSGNMSHCGTPHFYDHLDHCFIVFKHEELTFEAIKSTLSRSSNHESAQH